MHDTQIEWRNYGVPMVVAPRKLAPPTMPGFVIVGAIGAGLAALVLCSVLALQISTERGRLAELDARIAGARTEVAALDKQVAIKTRYHELYRWNAALGLETPRAKQFLSNGAALAAYAPHQPRLALTGDLLPEI